MSSSSGDHGVTFTYAVWYQEAGSVADDWYVMTGRDWKERYRHEAEEGNWETADMQEADDTAQALATGRAHPHDPTGRTYKKVVAAQVITIVRASKVTAVYGTPVAEGDA
jgi:hypothetical protein